MSHAPEAKASDGKHAEDGMKVSPRRLLLAACTEGNLSKAKKIIKQYELTRDEIARTKDRLGRTLLMLAAMCGNFKLAEYLVSLGASVNEVDNTGWTALSWAAREGYLPVIKLLCQRGAAIDTADVFGRTALLYAAHYEKTEVVTFLASLGARVDTNLLETFSPAIKDAVKEGQRSIVFEDDKKMPDLPSVVMAAAISMPLLSPAKSNHTLVKQQDEEPANGEAERALVLEDEVNMMVSTRGCGCPLVHARKCNFFDAQT